MNRTNGYGVTKRFYQKLINKTNDASTLNGIISDIEIDKSEFTFRGYLTVLFNAKRKMNMVPIVLTN